MKRKLPGTNPVDSMCDHLFGLRQKPTCVNFILELINHLFHENKRAPSPKQINVIKSIMESSRPTSDNPAPSFMIFRTPVNMWVRGNTRAIILTHWGEPSMENHTSDKNIIGQVIKFRIPPVNSSLVPLEATSNPRELRLRPPTKKPKKG